MNKITFGKLAPSEIAQAGEIVAQAFTPDERDAAETDFALTFSDYRYAPKTYVARDEKNKVVAVVQAVSAYIHFNTQGFAWLCVLPELQKQGIGKALLKYAEQDTIKNKFNHKAGTFILLAACDPAYYHALGYKGGETVSVDQMPFLVKHYKP